MPKQHPSLKKIVRVEMRTRTTETTKKVVKSKGTVETITRSTFTEPGALLECGHWQPRDLSYIRTKTRITCWQCKYPEEDWWWFDLVRE